MCNCGFYCDDIAKLNAIWGSMEFGEVIDLSLLRAILSFGSSLQKMKIDPKIFSPVLIEELEFPAAKRMVDLTARNQKFFTFPIVVFSEYSLEAAFFAVSLSKELGSKVYHVDNGIFTLVSDRIEEFFSYLLKDPSALMIA